MARGGTPQWQKNKHTTSYGTSSAKTTNYKNLKMHLNTTALEKIKGDLVNAALNHIRYGIVDSVTYPTGDPNGRAGMYVAEIWKKLEYGQAFMAGSTARIIPPRPIFAVHLKSNGKKDFQDVAREVIGSIFTGSYAREASWMKIGLRMQNSLKFTVETYKGFRPLSLPKGSPRSPYDFYDDTGYLKSQISYRLMPSGLDAGE